MKKFAIPLLVIMFLVLMNGSVKMVSGDHLEPDLGIFKNELEVNHIPSEDSKYKIYLIVEIRNAKGELISITETMRGKIIPHEITDYSFDKSLGQKEIIIIDNIKYEKVQYAFSPTLEERWVGLYPIFSENLNIKYNVDENVRAKIDKKIKDYSIWKVHYCATFEGHGYRCIPVFQTLIPTMTLEPNDTPNQIWTILRELG